MVAYGDSGPYLIYSYKFTGFSGKPGPKLREFDRQMPEGIYEIESYNPNSKFHLSMRLNYPNGFDKKNGEIRREGSREARGRHNDTRAQRNRGMLSVGGHRH